MKRGNWVQIDRGIYRFREYLDLPSQDTDHFVRAGELGDKIVQYGLVGGEEVARTAMQAPGFIGMIAGYFALLDERAVGFQVVAFAMVGLHSQAESDLRAFENRVLTWPVVRARAEIWSPSPFTS